MAPWHASCVLCTRMLLVLGFGRRALGAELLTAIPCPRSTLKPKELSPISTAQKGGGQQPMATPPSPAEQSPRAPRKGGYRLCATPRPPDRCPSVSPSSCLSVSPAASKKLAPIPPKAPSSGGTSEPPAGQPSPGSLSPTPPGTPAPYGLAYPQGYCLASGQLSPAAAPSPSPPPPPLPPLGSSVTKSRPVPKPRQRPSLPPPQPPTASASGCSPQPTEPPLLDAAAPGESVPTGNPAAAGRSRAVPGAQSALGHRHPQGHRGDPAAPPSLRDGCLRPGVWWQRGWEDGSVGGKVMMCPRRRWSPWKGGRVLGKVAMCAGRCWSPWQRDSVIQSGAVTLGRWQSPWPGHGFPRKLEMYSER